MMGMPSPVGRIKLHRIENCYLNPSDPLEVFDFLQDASVDSFVCNASQAYGGFYR
jgi:hypothetical protein